MSRRCLGTGSGEARQVSSSESTLLGGILEGRKGHRAHTFEVELVRAELIQAIAVNIC